VAIGNVIFVRDRNSLTNSEQPMRSFAIQKGPDGTKLELLASHRLNRISKKYRGMTYCFAFSASANSRPSFHCASRLMFAPSIRRARLA
jgi:hypothetical protein